MPETRVEGENAKFAERLERLEVAVQRQQRILGGLVEAGVVAACAAPFAVLILKVPRPDSLPFKLLFDLGHVLLSGLAAMIALRLSRRLLADVIRFPVVHYLLAAMAASALGGALEVWQIVGPGEPSIGDALRDVLGVIAGLCVAFSFDPTWGRASFARRFGLRSCAILLVFVSFVPAIRTVFLTVQHRSEFPRLATFETASTNRFVDASDGAELQVVEPPAAFTTARGAKVGKVVFAGGSYPKLELTGVGGDWSRYESLVFDVFSPATEPVRVELRIHDRQHNNTYGDRFNTPLLIPPGESTQVIPVERIRMGPEGRQMNLHAIEAIILFVESPSRPITLYFDSFQLE